MYQQLLKQPQKRNSVSQRQLRGWGEFLLQNPRTEKGVAINEYARFKGRRAMMVCRKRQKGEIRGGKNSERGSLLGKYIEGGFRGNKVTVKTVFVSCRRWGIDSRLEKNSKVV